MSSAHQADSKRRPHVPLTRAERLATLAGWSPSPPQRGSAPKGRSQALASGAHLCWRKCAARFAPDPWQSHVEGGKARKAKAQGAFGIVSCGRKKGSKKRGASGTHTTSLDAKEMISPAISSVPNHPRRQALTRCSTSFRPLRGDWRGARFGSFRSQGSPEPEAMEFPMFLAAIRTFLLWHRMEGRAFVAISSKSTIRARAMRGVMRNGLALALHGHAPKAAICRAVKHGARRKS